MKVQPNWWKDFFEGFAVTFWVQALSQEHTRNEADAVERALGVTPGAELLDVPCGGGRISLALAERGYRPMGVDVSGEFLDHARSCPGADRVTWEHREMRDLPWPGRFDGAFCVGNSFAYLDDEGNAAFLRAVSAALKPGARFVLSTPMVLENLLRQFHDRLWWKAGDVYLLVANKYDHTRSRLDVEYTFVSNGHIDVRHGSHRAYRYAELHELIERCGFEIAGGEPWNRDAPSVTFIATRR
jgi:2-polyprenyl-3-methyl-5-hydroxy-6-metoxy-1,4-benzoquinol methylase